MRHTCLRKEATVDTIRHPVDGECHLLLHLTFSRNIVGDKDLFPTDADEDVLHKNCSATDIVLLSGAPAIAPICPDDVNDDARRMHWGRRILGERLLLHHSCLS